MPEKATSPASNLSPADSRWASLGVCILLAAVVWVVFGQTLHYGFINFDDGPYVYENPEVNRGVSLKGVVWAFTHFHSDNWHPLTWISHMLDCQFYGLNAGGHHFTNVLLHAAAAILLFLVLRQMTGFLWRSAFVATVFAIHPLRVESVAWVAERKDVLSGVFFMLAVGAYAHYARRPWSLLRYGVVVFLFAFGLMCKPMLVTLPVVLLLLDFWPLNRLETTAFTEPVYRLAGRAVPKRLVFEKLPLLGLAAASSVVTFFAQSEAVRPLEQISAPQRLANALISCVAYIGQMFWPSKLAVLYPFPATGSPLWEVLFASALLLLISASFFAARKTRPYLLTGWLWYLIMLAPVIGIFQVGSQARADRYTYLPQIGIYLLLTWAMADLCARWRCRRWVLGGSSAVILVALIWSARVQVSYWRESESLWSHTLACTSDNFTAHNNLGVVLVEKGDLNDAIAQYEQALKIRPDYADGHSNLGNALLQKGDVDGAIAECQTALQLNPNNEKALNNLGNALLQKGRVDEAMAEFQKALQIDPDSPEAHNNLGNALSQRGRDDEAIARFEKSLQLKPDAAEAHYNLGSVLLRKGKVDEAIAHFQQALQFRPGYAEAHNNLGSALLQKGNLDEASGHFQKAIEIRPNYADAHYNLAAVLLQKGRIEDAIAHFRKALQNAPDDLDTQNNLAWLLATTRQESLRNGRQAVELAQQANQSSGGKNPVILRTLAAAYAEAGRFDDAIQNARTAIQLAEAGGLRDMVTHLNSELKLYETGLPLREENK